MNFKKNIKLWVDPFWNGKPGIGRVHHEIIKRLPNDFKVINKKALAVNGKMSPLYPWSMGSQIRNTSAGVYFTAGYMPPFRPGIPGCIIIHDLIHREYGSKLMKIYYDQILRRMLKYVTIIFTDSEASKEKIRQWANLANDKIIVLSLGVGKEFNPKGKKYNPGYPYLLSIGNRRPHKNIPRVLEAFALAKIDPNIKLLFSGHTNSEMANLINKFNIKQKVEFAGLVPEVDLPSVYRGAVGTLLPSLEEGFGFPIVESQACGTPVLTSNCSSMLEIAGGSAFLCNPMDTESIQDGVESLVNDRKKRALYQKQGLINIKRFNWDKTAKIAFRKLRSLASI